MYGAPLTENINPEGNLQPPARDSEQCPLGNLDSVQPAKRERGSGKEVLVPITTCDGVEQPESFVHPPQTKDISKCIDIMTRGRK